MKIGKYLTISLALILLSLAFSASANNISINTPVLTNANTANDYILVQFDLAWENSWLDDVNWDAAWVFVKYQETGGDWNHASLNTTAGNHTIPSGYVCSVGLTGSTGVGVFIFRNAIGSGNNSLADVKLRWEYGENGLADGAEVAVKVFVIEMVYVPLGSFYVGDSDNDQTNCFFEGGTTHEFLITGEGAITVANTAGNLYYDQDNGNAGDQTGPIPADFPKGHDAFYCMKYEISQGQYTDFLNTLTLTQDANRFPGWDGNNRHTIGGSAGNRTVSRPDRACNYLSWADGAAYTAWAGLRPMTELEFEKACRGPLPVVDDEYAWGSTTITEATTISGTENGTETITNTGANCCYNNVTNSILYTGGDGGMGPLRSGIFAQSATTREQAGASYYGIMELSGNLLEHIISVGNTAGRAYTGFHGEGVLESDGNANVSSWPGTNAAGAGFRGGMWAEVENAAYVCGRGDACNAYSIRVQYYGFRCVRWAP